MNRFTETTSDPQKLSFLSQIIPTNRLNCIFVSVITPLLINYNHVQDLQIPNEKINRQVKNMVHITHQFDSNNLEKIKQKYKAYDGRIIQELKKLKRTYGGKEVFMKLIPTLQELGVLSFSEWQHQNNNQNNNSPTSEQIVYL